MLILTKEDIKKVFNMKDAIKADEIAFEYLSDGMSKVPLRTNIDIPKYNGQSLFMPGYVQSLDAIGIKIVSVFPQNIDKGIPSVPADMILIDGKTGQVCCMMEGSLITQLRTGAAAGAATNILAKKDSKIGALFGTGGQAESQLEAMVTVRKLEEVKVFDINHQRAEAFVKKMQKKLQGCSTHFVSAQNAQEAVINADIITTVTTSTKPVFDGKWVKKGAHINGVGSYTPKMQELDEYLLQNADSVYVDSKDAVLSEAGDLLIPIEKGLFGKERIKGEIGEIILNRVKGRTNDEEITIFKTVGTAVLDVVAAYYIHKNAIDNEIGLKINL